MDGKQASDKSTKLLVLGKNALFIHQFSILGINHRNISAQISDPASNLAERIERSSICGESVTAEKVEAARKQWADKLAADPVKWNGETLALEKCELGQGGDGEDPTLQLWFRQTDYALARVAEDMWLELPLSERRSLTGSHLPDVDPFFSNGFGLNCTVETADGYVLVSRRGPAAHGWNGYWHTSFNEAVAPDDRDDGHFVDIIGGFRRGLKEELGLDLEQVPGFSERLTIHTLMLAVDTYQWGLLAHLDLSNTEFTADYMSGLRKIGAAPDAWEASEIRFIKFAAGPEEAIAEIERAEEWIPHGLLNLALSAIVKHPSKSQLIQKKLLSP